MEEQRYTIVVKEQTAIIYDEQGKPIPSSEYEAIAAQLIQGRRERRAIEAEVHAQTLQLQGEWVFPKKRSEIFSSGQCVYFVQAQGRPDVIKIGQTINLANRTKNLISQYDCEMDVVAFVRTRNHKQAETGFHALFRGVRVDGEWFEAPPVLTFLEQFRGV